MAINPLQQFMIDLMTRELTQSEMIEYVERIKKKIPPNLRTKAEIDAWLDEYEKPQ